jgi:phosphatidylethanolamine-binding protein (PEBP) family uncharacterized protein
MKKSKGGLTVWIDKITPCLIDKETGEELETVAYRIKSRRELKDYNQKTGWHINWTQVPKECEIFALSLKGDTVIQGLVAIRKDFDAGLPYLHWICAAPHNRKTAERGKKYEGVGAHLFAIAVDVSMQWGYGGEFHGFPANLKLHRHYIDTLGAKSIRQLHEYQIYLDEAQAIKLKETYDYEWV